jgi:multisubunit Na+/H+ antiporter MnhC subunit
MEWIIILIVYVLFIYGIFKLAKSKNRDPGGWILTSIIISPLIVLVILAIMQKLPFKKKTSTKKRKKITKRR